MGHQSRGVLPDVRIAIWITTKHSNCLALPLFIQSTSSSHWNKYSIKAQRVTHFSDPHCKGSGNWEFSDFHWIKASCRESRAGKSALLFCFATWWTLPVYRKLLFTIHLSFCVSNIYRGFVHMRWKPSPGAPGLHSSNMALISPRNPHLSFVCAFTFHSEHLCCGFTVS